MSESQKTGNPTRIIKTLFRCSLFAILAIAILITGVLLWINHGKSVYAQANTAYKEGDCQAALESYDKLKNYPAFVGNFARRSAVEKEECLDYQAAVQNAAKSDWAGGIAAYEVFLSDHPESSLSSLAIDNVAQSYMGWGGDLRQAADFAPAIEKYEQFAANYPDQKASAEEQILDSYLAWGEAQRSTGNFSTAVDIYDKMAIGYPAFGQKADDQILQTYLAWGESLSQEGSFSEAIAIYDEMEARGDGFAEAALEPRNQTYLDWGTILSQSAAYLEAEQVYRTLLEREHQRLAPLALSTITWPETWPYPYILIEVDPSQGILHTGPGTVYEKSDLTESQLASRYLGIVGVNPAGDWYAVDLSRFAQKSEYPQVDAMRDIDWLVEQTGSVQWILNEDVSIVLSRTHSIPLSGVFAYKLAEESQFATQALAGLQAVYTAWAAVAETDGDLNQATSLNLALAELAMEESTQQEIWQHLAALHLKIAEELAGKGDYAQSVRYTLITEDYDVIGEVTLPARILRVDGWMNLANMAVDLGDWETAVGYFEDVLTLEKETFSLESAIVAKAKTTLYIAPDPESEVVSTVDVGAEYPILAQQIEGDQSWVLLWAPTSPTSQAWVSSKNITLTVATEEIPFYDSASAPPLQSHAAVVNLAQVHQTWGQDLYTAGEYEDALIQYQAILSDTYMTAVITGTAELAARTWTDWGNSLRADGERADAVEKYNQALGVAPKSEAAKEATTAINETMTQSQQAVTEGGGCAEVPVLGALTKTTVAWKAEKNLPQAIYQCGQEHLRNSVTRPDELTEATAAFQRVIDDYPGNTYIQKAKRGLLWVDWITFVRSKKIEAAAKTVCSEAGKTAQASRYTLDKPYLVYVYGTSWNSNLPSGWKGADTLTSVIVCVGAEESRLIQSCPYTGGHTLRRYRSYRDVRMVDPVTRKTVLTTTLSGSSPAACPWSRYFSSSVDSVYGGSVSSSDLIKWLENYIK
jgi:tetratricopeptide (TPR) repeat protein